MNSFEDVMVKDMVTVLGATDELTPGHPAVVLLGPSGSVESDDQLPVLRSIVPEVRVVSVSDTRLTGAPPSPTPPSTEAPTPDARADEPRIPVDVDPATRPGPR